MSRKVIMFTGDLRRDRTHTTPSEQLQAWLDACEADEANVYDIGPPIVYNGIYLLVMYNIEPVVTEDSDDAACNVQCSACHALKKHYCRTCDAGKTVS